MKSSKLHSVQTAQLSYHLEYSHCKSPRCQTCSQHLGHGPYWYASLEMEGKVYRVYVGREFRQVGLNDFKHFYPKSKIEEVKFTQSQTSAKAQRRTQPQAQEQKVTQPLPRKTTKEYQKERKPSYFSDHIDTSKLQKKLPKTRTVIKSPPTFSDFKRDLFFLESSTMFDQLKSRYRQLVKKYHPDQYPNHQECSLWMSKINGNYTRLLREMR